MKSTACKSEFIQLRAAGQSYDAIAKALGISKSTCSAWETELAAQIALHKQQELNALYEEYGLVKAARIRRLGDTLARIDDAIAEADLSQIPPEKLLRLKLEYARELRDEYKGSAEVLPPAEASASDSSMYYLLVNLYNRLTGGEISVQQAKTELDALRQLKEACERATSESIFPDFGVKHKDLDGPHSLEAIASALDECIEAEGD